MARERQFSEEESLPVVFTAKEAARYLRFSESTVLRLVHQGFIPGVKIGRQWRFSRETILNLLKHPDRVETQG